MEGKSKPRNRNSELKMRPNLEAQRCTIDDKHTYRSSDPHQCGHIRTHGTCSSDSTTGRGRRGFFNDFPQGQFRFAIVAIAHDI
jgi:hypothetical protein